MFWIISYGKDVFSTLLFLFWFILLSGFDSLFDWIEKWLLSKSVVGWLIKFFDKSTLVLKLLLGCIKLLIDLVFKLSWLLLKINGFELLIKVPDVFVL